MEHRLYEKFEDFISAIKRGQAGEAFFSSEISHAPAEIERQGAKVQGQRIIAVVKFTAVDKERKIHFGHIGNLGDNIATSQEEATKYLQLVQVSLDGMVNLLQSSYPSCE